MPELTYDLHGFLGVRYVYRFVRYGRYVDNEYCTLRTDKPFAPEQPTLTFYLDAPAPPDLPPADLTLSHRFLCFKFQATVHGLFTPHTSVVYHGDWTIRVWRNIQGILLQANVIEPLIHLKMLQNGVLMMHSACVASDVHAAIMPAHGGTGKTTTALTLAHRGYGLLGDDFVFICPETGQVYSYLRPLHLFAYVLDRLTFLQISPWVTLSIRIKNVLRHVLSWATGESFALATRAHIADVQPSARCIPSAPIGPLILLDRKGELHHQYDLDDPAERERFLTELRPTMELSNALREILLGKSPEIVARVNEIEDALLDRVLRTAKGIHQVNCRHEDNQDSCEIRRLLDKPAPAS